MHFGDNSVRSGAPELSFGLSMLIFYEECDGSDGVLKRMGANGKREIYKAASSSRCAPLPQGSRKWGCFKLGYSGSWISVDVRAFSAKTRLGAGLPSSPSAFPCCFLTRNPMGATAFWNRGVPTENVKFKKPLLARAARPFPKGLANGGCSKVGHSDSWI